jgi:hypothetical protein
MDARTDRDTLLPRTRLLLAVFAFGLGGMGLLVLASGCGDWPTDDADYVFRKAFWCDVPDGVTVHEGLLHEYRRGPLVEHWQWYIALTPDAPFRRWLLSESAFRLRPLPRGGMVDRSSWLWEAPEWFAPAGGTYDVWQTADEQMTVLVDREAGVVYATDYGIQ